jgi:hypothetical protein
MAVPRFPTSGFPELTKIHVSDYRKALVMDEMQRIMIEKWRLLPVTQWGAVL